MNELMFDQLTTAAKRADWLKRKANWIRLSAMTMTNHAKLGHTGGDLSSADILAVLYMEVFCASIRSTRPGQSAIASSSQRGIVLEPSTPLWPQEASFLSNNSRHLWIRCRC